MSGLNYAAENALTLSCTVCAGETGRQVRAGVFEADFLVNVVSILSPLLVVAIVVAAIAWERPLRSTCKHEITRDA